MIDFLFCSLSELRVSFSCHTTFGAVTFLLLFRVFMYLHVPRVVTLSFCPSVLSGGERSSGRLNGSSRKLGDPCAVELSQIREEKEEPVTPPVAIVLSPTSDPLQPQLQPQFTAAAIQ